MRRKQSSDVKKVAIGAGLAAAAGYIVGVLTAPKSGKQTRKDISRTAKKGMKEAEKELKKLQRELDGVAADVKSKTNELSNKAGKEVTSLVDKANQAKDKVHDVVGAFKKDGKVDDKDLKKAIDEANKAIDNIRKYLKK